MNRNQTIFMVSAICCAMIAWQLWDHGSASVSGNPAAQPPQLQTESVPRTDAAITDRVDARPETENVLGLTVRTDRDCTVQTRHIADAETGELLEAYSCEPNYPPEPDPYESWDEATLAAMAYGDAHAAEVLGLRHVRSADPRQEALGLSLLYRSVALSADPDTFHKAISVRYAYVEIDGEPQLHNLRQLLVFGIIGEALGDPRLNPTQFGNDLRAADVPHSEIEQIHTGARRVLRGMADLQTELTGDTSISEALDNA